MKVPVWIDETTGLDRPGEPLVGGVPLPRGACMTGGDFVLDAADGSVFAMQGSPAAWWPDGSIKWLHLAGELDLRGGVRNVFALRPGKVGRPPALAVETLPDGGVRVSGPHLSATLRADADRVLEAVRPSADPTVALAGPGLSASLVYTDPEGVARIPCAWSFAPDTKPQVVVQSPARVVLRLGGEFRLPGAEAPLLELILFVEILAGQPELRLQAVAIFLATPETHLLKALDLRVHTTVQGDDCRYGFARERGLGYWDDVYWQREFGGPRWPQARLVQLGSSFYRIEKHTDDPAGSWVKAVEGQRSPGWCHLARPGLGGVTLATRHFWQEYPRSLAVDAATGTLTAGLWPDTAAPLDLRRYSYTLYGEGINEYANPKWDRFPSSSGAPGIAKCHELMLRFHDANEDDVPARALRYLAPVLPLTPPDWFCATRVLGHLAPPEPARHPVEAVCTRTMQYLVDERAARGWYGQMDWGDIMIAYYRDKDRWAYDDGGYAWINTEHIIDYGFWMTALRHARRDWLQAAIDMTRHNRDIDSYHRGERTGLGTRHNVNHWGCGDKEWRVTQPLTRRLHYYLCADPWTRETIDATIAVYQSYDRATSLAPSMSAALIGLMVKYELTHDPADGQALDHLCDAFAAAFRPDGEVVKNLRANLATGVGHPEGDAVFDHFWFINGFGCQHAMAELAELLDHAGLHRAAEAYVRRFLRDPKYGNYHSLLPFLGVVWRRTRNPEMLAAVRQTLDTIRVPLASSAGGDGLLDEPAHPILENATRRNKIGCWLGGAVLHKTPWGLAILDEAP